MITREARKLRKMMKSSESLRLRKLQRLGLTESSDTTDAGHKRKSVVKLLGWNTDRRAKSS